jgi:L-malate glycosyltransferase
MHIFVIPSGYPTEVQPNRGIFYKEQVKALHNNGYQVTVLFPEVWSLKHFGQFKDKATIMEELEDGVPTFRLKGYNFLPGLPYSNEGIFYTRLKKLYKKAVKKYGKPDIMHAHSMFWAGYAAAKLSKEVNIPLVVTEHSSVIGRNLLKEYQKKLLKNALPLVKEIIAVGPRLKEELQSYAPGRTIHLIPNGVDIPNHNFRKEKQPDKFFFLSIANLNQNKGMDILIRAFHRAFKGMNEVQLKIGGNGPEKSNLEVLVKELKISNQVDFLGALSHQDVLKEMEETDVFVLASRYETFGVVYIEALSKGKPIIATDCGGPSMIVNKNNGLLVPVNNIESLCDAMQKIMADYETYNPDQIIQNCIAKFSQEKVIQQISQIYEKVQR